MTPQSSFMVLAPVAPAREAELRRLLDSHERGARPGQPEQPAGTVRAVRHPACRAVPHSGRQDPRRRPGVYGLPSHLPLYLAFARRRGWRWRTSSWRRSARRVIRRASAIFRCCEGFAADGDLADWMKRHSTPSAGGLRQLAGPDGTSGAGGGGVPRRARSPHQEPAGSDRRSKTARGPCRTRAFRAGRDLGGAR